MYMGLYKEMYIYNIENKSGLINELINKCELYPCIALVYWIATNFAFKSHPTNINKKVE